MATFRVPGRPQRSYRFGASDRSLDALPKAASTADLHRALQANTARIEDGRRVAKGEVAWLAALCSHPQADPALIDAVQVLLGQTKLTPAATQSGARDFLDGLSQAARGAVPPQTARPPQTGGPAGRGALQLRLSVLAGQAFDFGPAASDLPRVPEGASAADLGNLVALSAPKVRDGDSLSTGELAWLLAVATHPAADNALRGHLNKHFGHLPLHSAAPRREGEAFMAALAPKDAYAPQFGVPEAELGSIPESRDEAGLQQVLKSARRDLKDNGRITGQEAAWLHHLSTASHAGPALHNDIASLLRAAKPGGGVTQTDLDTFAQALETGAPIVRAVRLESPEPVATRFSAAPNPRLGPIPHDADAADLGVLLDVQLKRLGRASGQREAGPGDVAWMCALAAAPGADAALRRKVGTRLRHVRLTDAARSAGASDAIAALSRGAAVTGTSVAGPLVEVRFGPAQAELGAIPQAADEPALRALLQRVRPDLDDGNNLRNSELGWLHALVTHPAASDTLGQDVVALMDALPLAPNVAPNEAQVFRAALESGAALAPPAAAPRAQRRASLWPQGRDAAHHRRRPRRGRAGLSRRRHPPRAALHRRDKDRAGGRRVVARSGHASQRIRGDPAQDG